MELVDCHSHTVYSGHGEGTVAQMVAAAEARGCTTYALTEHLWLPDEIDPAHGDSMTLAQMDAYRAELAAESERLSAQGSTMELVGGVEADWLPGRADELRRLTAPFPYVLGSVHFLDGLAVDCRAETGIWPVLGVDETWRRYFEAWLEMAASNAGITAFSHPDLPKKYGVYPSFDLRGHYREMAAAAAESGCMVEVNTAGLRKPVGEAYPCVELLRAFHEAGVDCTVGSDAHCPEDVARDVPRAFRLMREAGYRRVAVPTADGGRRYIDLEA